jgi:hypothetical protein
VAVVGANLHREILPGLHVEGIYLSDPPLLMSGPTLKVGETVPSTVVVFSPDLNSIVGIAFVPALCAHAVEAVSRRSAKRIEIRTAMC